STAASGTKISRRYHRSLSKQRIKLSKYRLRGSTHRKGIAATFCVRWLVTARRRAEAQAARPIQIRRSEKRGVVDVDSAAAGGGAPPERHATIAQTITNAA